MQEKIKIDTDKKTLKQTGCLLNNVISTSERSLITLIICNILAQYYFDNWNIQMKEIGTIKNKQQMYLNSCQNY